MTIGLSVNLMLLLQDLCETEGLTNATTCFGGHLYLQDIQPLILLFVIWKAVVNLLRVRATKDATVFGDTLAQRGGGGRMQTAGERLVSPQSHVVSTQ